MLEESNLYEDEKIEESSDQFSKKEESINEINAPLKTQQKNHLWNQSSIDQKSELTNITGANMTGLFPSRIAAPAKDPNEHLYHKVYKDITRKPEGRMPLAEVDRIDKFN